MLTNNNERKRISRFQSEYAFTNMKDVGFAFTQVDRWVLYDIPYVKLKKESCRATTQQCGPHSHLNRAGPQMSHVVPVLAFYRKRQVHERSTHTVT